MRSLRTTLIAAALTLSIAPPVHAGRKTTAAVVINTATRTASGSLGSARNSSDSTQYIGCQATYYPNLDPNSGSFSSTTYFCYARSSAGTTGACSVPLSTDFVDIYAPIAEDSFLQFSWDAAGNCTSLRVENYSYYAPVQP